MSGRYPNRVAPNTPAAAGLTFIRITVTTASIDAPTPTLAPTARPGFTAEQPAGPVFPDWLDPELNDERPVDDVVFEGWLDYRTNTYIEHTRADGRAGTAHFCDEGTLAGANDVIDKRFLSGVPRTSSLSTIKFGGTLRPGAITATFCGKL